MNKNPIKLMILASTPSEAIDAQNAGIDRVFYDLEYIGKAERQRGRNTVKSMNSIDDIPKVRSVVTTSELLVRTNPITPIPNLKLKKRFLMGQMY